ncbi:hypothetical protein NLG97_g6100 [Lecanicillium saksenae]|uniref:Uncharacterized protein n=1 Tax=Lecanicillium saksenae TaxID=468837 RepID=A0ACC1QQM0_9HYPO|nr:hypothetical protein NLG97_g6100 [Lecanicillium saksenae]
MEWQNHLLPNHLISDVDSSASIEFSSSFQSRDDYIGDLSHETDFDCLAEEDVLASGLDADTPAVSEQAAATPIRGRLTTEEWDKHKPIIEGLYLDKKRRVEDIVKFMRDNHEFDASAKQYRTRFKKWQFHKNLNSNEMRKIIQIQRRRKEEEGKDSHFYVRKRLVPEHKIARYDRLNGNKVTASSPAWKTPPYIEAKTPRNRDSTTTSGDARSQQGSAYVAQDCYAVAPAPPEIFMFDVFMQDREGDGIAAHAEPPAKQVPRIQLELAWKDRTCLASLCTNYSGEELQRSIQNVQLQMHAEATKGTSYRRCGRCGHLPTMMDTTKQDMRSLFDYGYLKMNMTDALFVRACQIGIKQNEVAMVVYLARRCQQSTFLQRLHPSLLCMALHHNRDDVFRWLLLHGIDAGTGFIDASKELLAHARMALGDFVTALFERESDGRIDDAIAFLYRTRVITDNCWKRKLIWVALKHGRAGILETCLEPPTNATLDIDELMDKAEDIRKIMSETGSKDAAATLVSAAETRETKSEDGANALHFATALLLCDAVSRLCANGADINAAMENGETPLHILSGLSDDGVQTARILLTANANVAARDSVGDTPLHNAARHALVPWRQELISCLLHAGADIEARNARGETPLIAAAINVELDEAADAMQWLIDKGANAQAMDHADNTAQDYLRARLSERDKCRLEEEEFCAQPIEDRLRGWFTTGLQEHVELRTRSQHVESLRSQVEEVDENVRESTYGNRQL